METQASEDSRSDRNTSEKLIPNSVWFIVGLVYTSSILIAAEQALLNQLRAHDAGTIFSSQQSATVFLRVCVVMWALALTFFQGIVLGLIYSVATGGNRPKIGECWGYVLLAQMPLSVAIFILFALGNYSAVEAVNAPWVQHLTGILTAVAFAFLASRRKKVDRRRMAAFVALATATNSAMLVLSYSFVL